MSSLKELAAGRERAGRELEKANSELADLQRRHDELVVLVAERAQFQRDAALDVERSGGGDSKALTKAVAAHQESQARLDAIVGLMGEARVRCESADAALRIATREEAAGRHQAAVADALADVSKLGGEVKAAFEALALTQGSYLAAYQKLASLDLQKAEDAGKAVSAEALVGGLVAAGFQPVMWGSEKFSSALPVPAMIPAPAQPEKAA